MFPQLVYELVLNTERYDQILGYLEPDGCRVKGLYDEFADSKVRFFQKVYVDCVHIRWLIHVFRAVSQWRFDFPRSQSFRIERRLF